MLPLISHYANAGANVIRWPKKSCYISFWSSWTTICSGAIDDAISVMWCQHWYNITKEVMLHLVSIILTMQTKYCPCQCHQCHVLLALALMASQNPKSHVIPSFNCLHLMNKMVPLMIPLALHDRNAGTNGITWMKKPCFIPCWWLWPNECNGIIDNTTDITVICQKVLRHV